MIFKRLKTIEKRMATLEKKVEDMRLEMNNIQPPSTLLETVESKKDEPATLNRIVDEWLNGEEE